MEIWIDWLRESDINWILLCLIANNGYNGWLFYLIQITLIHSDSFFSLKLKLGGRFIELNWWGKVMERFEEIL